MDFDRVETDPAVLGTKVEAELAGASIDELRVAFRVISALRP